MELFTVNRYDETKLNDEDGKAQEELLLQQLQARKERKMRLRASKAQVDSGQEVEQQKVQLLQPLQKPCDNEISDQDKESVTLAQAPQDDLQLEPTKGEAESNDNQEQSEADDGGKKMGDFIVLGGDKQQRLQKTDEVLPPWLSHPTMIGRDVSVKGPLVKTQSYLDEVIKSNLEKMGYEQLFPVQEKVIPWILGAHRKPAPFWPRDVCISSPTGSGKTLAFAVPIVQMLLRRIAPAIRALVVLPVQELAEQVHEVFRNLCIGTNVRPVVLSRRLAFEIEQNTLVKYCNGEYVPKVDIVVTTAGRLVEHLHSTKGFTLRQMRFLVVDEADQVMNQIQNDWLYHLNKHVKQESDEYLLGRSTDSLSQTELFELPRQPHKMLFSATFTRDAEKLKTLKLFHPKLFTTVIDLQELTAMGQLAAHPEQRRGKFAGQYTTPIELKELVCVTLSRTKPLTLYSLIRENNYRKFLVFTNGIAASHRLSFVLQRLFGTEMIVEEWSSSLSPAARRSVLSRFSMGKVNGIICTDALARGIDIENIEVVVSYDMPKHIDTYIHRIGRTARAGNRGTAITMLLEEEKKKFVTLLREANKEELEQIHTKPTMEEEYAAKYSSALHDLREALQLETDVIAKIRDGMSIGSLTKVNLLTKLKDQLDIGYSTDIIKTLKYLPKSWTNEAIEIKAMEQRSKTKNKLVFAQEDATALSNVTTATTSIESTEGVNGKSKKKKGKAAPANSPTPKSSDPKAGDIKIESQQGNQKRKRNRVAPKAVNDHSDMNGQTNEIENNRELTKTRNQKKRKASNENGSDIVNIKQPRWKKKDQKQQSTVQTDTA